MPVSVYRSEDKQRKRAYSGHALEGLSGMTVTRASLPANSESDRSGRVVTAADC